MKSINEIRKQHPELDYLSDQQLEHVRDSLYVLARIAVALSRISQGSKNNL
jgi:hypothetical protein